jgi:hypothetical protein
MKHHLDLQVTEYHKGARDIPFSPSRMFNAGSAGRDEGDVKKHIEELLASGIPVSPHVPTVYGVSDHLLTTCQRIQVHGQETGGEVEYVLLWHGGDVYVTVGSDHTDYGLERHSGPKAKNVCPNIVAPTAWRYEDIAPHFDELKIEADIRINGEWSAYQRGAASSLLPPSYWFEKLSKQDLIQDGLTLFSGTIPTVNGLLFGEAYKIRIVDPIRDQYLEHEYSCDVISEFDIH